jgi:hypothetical protein
MDSPASLSQEEDVRQFMPRPVASVAALAAAAVLVTGVVAAPGGAATTLAPRALASGAASAPTRTIVLLNGDKLVTGPAPGIPALVPGARSRLAGPMLALDLGGQAYDIPQVVLPYLGRSLDPDLFGVSSLRRAETAERLPVTVSYRGRVPSLPGVTISRAGGGTARGYLLPAGAAAFGAALARQFIADHARGSYGQDGLFADGVSIRLAGVPATARPATAFPMHTLTVTGTNLAGKPDTGDQVMIFNADNSARFADPVESGNVFDKGVTKFSVPAGHYWAIGAFSTVLKNHKFEWHVPILPQFTVSANTTVHIDERAADSLIGVKTPRAAAAVDQTLELRHPGAAGPAASIWWFGGYSPLFISPTTRRPTVGTLQAYVFEHLFSPAKAPGTPYEYSVAFADTSGLIPPQHYVVRSSSLATVHARYYSDVSTTGYESRFGVFPVQWRTVPGVLFLSRRMPRQQTEYLTGNPAVLWADTAEQSYQGLAGGQLDDLRTFHAGEQLDENWNAYPLHAGYNTNLVGAANPSRPPAPSLPSASRQGNALTLDVMPFSDSTLGHLSASGFFGGLAGSFGKIAGHYEIDENGKSIAAGNPLRRDQEVGPFGEFQTRVTLNPHPATIRFVLDASRKARIYTVSTASHTVWTWRSQRESGARLAAGWSCALTRRDTEAGGRSCAVQPMMTLEYAVAGLSLHGSTRPGRQVLHLSAGHLQLAKATPVTKAAVSVSFDGGKAWHRAKITGHGGSYTATFRAPAGVKVSLRTTAADAAGGTIAETIANAYQISS